MVSGDRIARWPRWLGPLVEVVGEDERGLAEHAHEAAGVVVDLVAKAGGDDGDVRVNSFELAFDEVGGADEEDFVATRPREVRERSSFRLLELGDAHRELHVGGNRLGRAERMLAAERAM